MIDAWLHTVRTRCTGEDPLVRIRNGDARGTGSSSGRAVSYALGFLLVFSVVIAGTFAMFALGVETLSTADEDESLASNQENLAVIHSEIGDMTAQGAPRRTLDLEVIDAMIGFSTPTELTLRIESHSDAFQPIEYNTRVFRYDLQDRAATLHYAFGHGYRTTNSDGPTGVSELPPVFDASGPNTQFVVPTLTGPASDGPAEIGVSGIGERTVEAISSTTESLTRTHATNGSIESSTGTVSIAGVTQPSAWEDALEATGFSAVDTRQISGRTTVTGTFQGRTISVRTAAITFHMGDSS